MQPTELKCGVEERDQLRREAAVDIITDAVVAGT